MKKIIIFLSFLLAIVSAVYADDIKPSTSVEKPEFLYTMRNGTDNAIYANDNTAPTDNSSNYGVFAFFAVSGKTDAYYIYSVNAKKYLSYQKEASYDNGMNQVTLVDVMENYFCVKKCSDNDTFYEIHPYKSDGTVAGPCLNWFGGVDNNTYYHWDQGTLGLWEQNGDADAGSRFYFAELYKPYRTGERKSGNTTFDTRYITKIDVNGVGFDIAEDEQKQYYVDKTTETLTVIAGESVKVALTTTASWMHSYVYIDKENNGFFAQVGDDTYTPIGDLVSFSAYKAGNSDRNYNNSIGEVVSDGVGLNAIPEFTAPATPGQYRMRYKMDWNDINPAGEGSFISNSGFMVDFMLDVVHSVSSRTITVSTDYERCVVKANGVEGGVTAEGIITLTAEPGYGYRFVEWLLDGESVSTDATYVDRTEGDKNYVAVFEHLSATEQYDDIAKPKILSVHNPSWVDFATISNGIGILDHNENIVPSELRNNNQKGSSVVIPVAKGARFNLDILFELHWGDLSIIKIEKGVAERVCDRIEGSWPDAPKEVVIEHLKEKFDVDENNVVSLPVTIGEDLVNEDIVVIRIVFANDYELTTPSVSDATYFDFVFVVGGYDLNVSAAEHATMSCGLNTIIPDDVEAYIATRSTSTQLFLERVTGVLPKGTGIIVKASPGTYRFEYTVEETEGYDANILVASVNPTYVLGDGYVLSKPSGKEVGLYKAILNKDENGAVGTTHFLSNANKAYLPASAVPAEARLSAGFRFNFDGTTDIEEVCVDEKYSSMAIYDIFGRRVSDTSEPGIYIVNGKKVLVK